MMLKSFKAAYGEIVRKDCYKLDYWPNHFFDCILDIGANVGVFVVYAGMRNPHADIFAYEPCKATYQALVGNTWYFDRIKHFNKALGNGEALWLHDTGAPGSNLFYRESEPKPKMLPVSEPYSVASATLSQIFIEADLKGKCCVKIDCEGGERFILHDHEATERLKRTHAVCLEIHFPPRRQTANFDLFQHFPTWDTWDKWVAENFASTHDILYHCSNGKTRGAGTYVMRLK